MNPAYGAVHQRMTDRSQLTISWDFWLHAIESEFN